MSTPCRTTSRQFQRLESALTKPVLDKNVVATLTWNGIPAGQSRRRIWQLLLDYSPAVLESCEESQASKRQEYEALKKQLYDSSHIVFKEDAGGSSPCSPSKLSGEEVLLRQIRKDLPRMHIRLGPQADAKVEDGVVKNACVQSMMERILFIWAMEKSTSAYAQGIDSILLLFIVVFLADQIECEPCELTCEVLESLGQEKMREIEADSYWCMTKILSLMYDHHDEGFTGIHRMTQKIMQLVWRIDESLARHLDNEGINILAAGVRWIGCLMVREFSVDACARLWDTLIAEYAQAPDQGSEGFESILLYFCACYFVKYTARLQEMDFEAIMMFLGRPPPDPLDLEAIALLLAEAFFFKSSFHQAQNHLGVSGKGESRRNNSEQDALPKPSASTQLTRHLQRFKSVLSNQKIDTKALAVLAWKGVPSGQNRSLVWQLLLGYRSSWKDDCEECLQSKRQQYAQLRAQYYDASPAIAVDVGDQTPSKLSGVQKLLRQIQKDLPRMQVTGGSPESKALEQVIQHPEIQSLMERVLFVWAMQKSTSAYAQGIDSILLQFVLIVLAEQVGCDPTKLDFSCVDHLTHKKLSEVEADVFWCMSKLLSLMYDHHDETFSGVHRMTTKLMELIWRIDERLALHLDNEGINILATGVRWIGCLMVRELPVDSCSRLWDTLIAEYAQEQTDRASESFETMLLYFLVCFLGKYSSQLLEMDFEAMTVFLGRAPPDLLDVDSVEVLVGEAFVLKSMFHQAQNHLKQQKQ